MCAGLSCTRSTIAQPETGLRRLTADRDELQVGREFAVEARSTARANHSLRLLVGELLAAARTATLLESFQAWLHLHP